MGLEETLALTPALSPRRRGSTHSSRNFHALWCGIASWGLTSAATVHGPNTRAKANDHRLKAVLDAGIVPNSEVSFISRNRSCSSSLSSGRTRAEHCHQRNDDRQQPNV